jgi:hypothetical protein
MAKDPFGPDFRRQFDRELKRLQYHDQGGREQPQEEKPPKLIGKPGSAERIAWIASQADPAIVEELGWDQARANWTAVGTFLQNTLNQISAVENSEYFDGRYPEEVSEQFASAIRVLASTNDPTLTQAFQTELEDSGSDLIEYFAPALDIAQQHEDLNTYEAMRGYEQARLDERGKMLETEYQQIQKRTGPGGLQAADALARGLGDTLYSPNLGEDELRASMRSTAEQAHATQRGLGQMAFFKAFDDEVAKKYGPGAVNDETRERWESDLRATTLETVDRAFGNPQDAADRAIGSMIVDDRKAATGKGLFQEQVENAMDELDSHSKQNLPHAQAFADEAVEDWEATHDSDGFERTTQDGQGREHGGRFDPVRRDR